jgi:hypothetical protein
LAVREDEEEEEKVAPKLVAEKSAHDAPLQRQAGEDEEEKEEALQTAPLVQRLCTECEEEKKHAAGPAEMVHRQAASGGPFDDEEEEGQQVQPKVARTPASGGTAPVADNIRALSSGGGSPLPQAARAFFEPRFGADFGHVRVHTDSRAAQTAGSINARAFTVGRDIAFGAGQYAPHSHDGRQLLAHELTHVVQQGAASTLTQTVQRQAEETLEEPVFEPSAEKLEEMEDEGQPVEQVGLVEPDEGTYLWPSPDPKRAKPALGLLPINTRVFVDRKLDGGWYLVYVEGHQRGQALPVPEGTHGYVAAARVNTDMPDPGSWFYRVTTGGQGALALAGQLYKDNFKASWGKDYRYLVNVLVAVNEAKKRRFIYKEDPDDSWDEAKTLAGGKIWVPGLELVEALHGQVSSGSISYEVLTTLAEISIGVAAFIVGLLHGAVMSIADIFIGLKDLVVMVIDLVKKLFQGTLISDAKSFFEDISKIKMSDIIDMVGAKWNAPSTWDRWKFRGYVIGYAIVEILLLIFSAGALTAIKWAGKVSKVGKFAEYLSKLPKVQKVISAAKTLKGKAVDEIRTALKAAHAMSEAHGWAARVLRLPLGILKRLSEVDIGKLKKLPQWARERFSRLTDAVKLRYLGCASPCKVDVRQIEAALKLIATTGKKLTSADDVLAVLKKLSPDLKTAKISRKLRKTDSAIMAAIKEADITDADFAKLADFLTPGDLASPANAYNTFMRYVTGVVPAKSGNDINKLNKIAAAVVKAEPGRGSAMKGSMFEQWIALHVPQLASHTYTRIRFDLWKLLRKKTPPYSRPVDKWLPDTGEIWEIKHHLSKVPKDQVEDFAKLVGKTAPDGKVVTGVRYVFPMKAAAELNKELATTYGFVVYYIDDATNALTRLL